MFVGESNNTVEAVCFLSKFKTEKHIEVELNIGEVDYCGG